MGLSAFVMLLMSLGACVDAQSVKMTWCYSSTTCAGGCVSWTAQDGTCYPGTNNQPAARVFVNTTRNPPADATLIGYSTSSDCSGIIVSAVPMPLDGNCYAAGTQSFRASINGASSLGVMTGITVAVAVTFWSVLH
jgi:hypothetical protein